MDFKRLISHFAYKVEPKPEGGFVAHTSDPSVPPLEAATREELYQKIQAKITSEFAAEFPALKVPLENKGVKFDFHVEHKPGGGFVLQSTDGKELPVVGGTHAEFESKFAEKVLGALGITLMPELSKAGAPQASFGNVKTFANQQVNVTTGSPKVSSTDAGPVQADDPQLAALLNAGNAPITPEPNTLWPFIRFLIVAIIFAAIIFFFRYR